MTRARIRRGASILFASFLAALSLSAGRAEAGVTDPPPPDLTGSQTPIPVLILLSQSMQQLQARAQPVTCPRHTKPRVDCTPVVQPPR
jgi:hypothetical protein